jgi:uracil-DNA glycosylase
VACRVAGGQSIRQSAIALAPRDGRSGWSCACSTPGMPVARLAMILAIVSGCAAHQALEDDDEDDLGGKEDAAGVIVCDSLPAASKRLCLQIPNNGWRSALKAELTQPYFERLAIAVADARDADAATTSVEANVYPAEANTFAALSYVSPGRVKVVIVGQDPYIGVDQAIGLSFAVAPGLAVPPSLNNIYAELVREAADPVLADELPYGFRCPADGDLRPWAKRGVFLLNAMLTVRHGVAGSHAAFGWQQLTNAILRIARDRNADDPVAYLLWGSFARASRTLILEHGESPNILVLESNHPSPLTTGFVGNGHFAAADRFLVDHGHRPIDWSLPAPAAGVTTAHSCREL